MVARCPGVRSLGHRAFAPVRGRKRSAGDPLGAFGAGVFFFFFFWSWKLSGMFRPVATSCEFWDRFHVVVDIVGLLAAAFAMGRCSSTRRGDAPFLRRFELLGLEE